MVIKWSHISAKAKYRFIYASYENCVRLSVDVSFKTVLSFYSRCFSLHCLYLILQSLFLWARAMNAILVIYLSTMDWNKCSATISMLLLVFLFLLVLLLLLFVRLFFSSFSTFSHFNFWLQNDPIHMISMIFV